MRRRGVQRSEVRGQGVGRWRYRFVCMWIHCPQGNRRAAFSDFSTPRPVFRCFIFRIHVDGRPKWCNTCAFLQKSILVWTAPQTHLTHVVSTYGTGMLMTTSLSSRLSSCSSYSMLTSQPLPLSEGQQLTVEKQRSHDSNNEERNTTREQQHIKMAQLKHMCCHSLVRGMRDSSVVCNLHFSTPTSLLRGKDFSGFFRPTTDSAVNNFLSTLGCVWEDTDTIITTIVIMLLNPSPSPRLLHFIHLDTLSFIIYY